MTDNQDHTAVTNAIVSVTAPDGSDVGITIPVDSAADGMVTFQSCQLGSFLVHVQAEGFIEASTKIVVGCEQEDFDLERAVILSTISTTTTITTTTEEGSTNCDPEWTHFAPNEKCYKWFAKVLTWEEARKECEDLYSILVTIPNEETNNFLIGLSKELSWTGGYLKDDADNWRWLDGTRFDFSPWGDGQPDDYGGNEDKIELNYPDDGLWNDKAEATCSKGFFCQYTPESRATTGKRRFDNKNSCYLGWC